MDRVIQFDVQDAIMIPKLVDKTLAANSGKWAAPTTDRGCTGEFSCAKAKKVLVPRTQEKTRRKKRHEAQFMPPPKSAISTFNKGGQYSTDNYFAMLASRPPGFRDVVAHVFCMRVQLRG